MTLRFTRLEAATGIVTAAQASLALLVATMPSAGPVPMHFDLAGRPDRWGDAREAAMVIALMAAISLLAGGGLAWSARSADEARRRGLAWGQIVLLLTTCIIAGMGALIAITGGDGVSAAPRISVMGMALLFAVIGAVMGKVAPNAMVGVRTPWSRASRLAWEKSNRLAGRLFFWLGLGGLVAAPALPIALANQILIGGVLLSAALSVFESWRVWRSDPERIPV
jgi:uncharacterized membrane protein